GDGTLSGVFQVANLGVNQGRTLFTGTATQSFGVGINIAAGGASLFNTGDRGLQQALRSLSIATGVWNTGTEAVAAYQTSKATLEALRPTPIQVRAGGSGIQSGRVTQTGHTSEGPMFTEADAGWQPLNTRSQSDSELDAFFNGKSSGFVQPFLQTDWSRLDQPILSAGGYGSGVGYSSTSDNSLQAMLYNPPDLFAQMTANEEFAHREFWRKLRTQDPAVSQSLNAEVENLSIAQLGSQVGIQRNCMICHNPTVMYGGDIRTLPLSMQLGIAEAVGMTHYNPEVMNEKLGTLRTAGTIGRRAAPLAIGAGTAFVMPPAGVAIIGGTMGGTSAGIEYAVTGDADRSMDLIPFVGLRHVPQHAGVLFDGSADPMDRTLAGFNIATSAMEVYFGAKGGNQLLNRAGYQFYKIPYSASRLNSSINPTGVGIRRIAETIDDAPSLQTGYGAFGYGRPAAITNSSGAASFFNEFASVRSATSGLTYQQWWGRMHVDANGRQLTGGAPFGNITSYTKSGGIKTVTTFDQFGRPYKQYGFNEGHPFHSHDFQYPTFPQLGTGWKPIRLPGVDL
ncbi:MAG: hypothetical protein WCO86_13770, partial [Planctomycetota bacterium]